MRSSNPIIETKRGTTVCCHWRMEPGTGILRRHVGHWTDDIDTDFIRLSFFVGGSTLVILFDQPSARTCLNMTRIWPTPDSADVGGCELSRVEPRNEVAMDTSWIHNSGILSQESPKSSRIPKMGKHATVGVASHVRKLNEIVENLWVCLKTVKQSTQIPWFDFFKLPYIVGHLPDLWRNLLCWKRHWSLRATSRTKRAATPGVGCAGRTRHVLVEYFKVFDQSGLVSMAHEYKVEQCGRYKHFFRYFSPPARWGLLYRFYQSCSPPPPPHPPPPPRSPDPSGHCRTSTATSRSQWALPDFNRELQIPGCTAGPQARAPDPSGHCRTSTASSRSQWALPDLNRDFQIAVGTAGPQPRLPDRSGHCRTSTATSRSQWALPDLNRDFQIAVGTTGPQPRLPDRSGHCRTSTGRMSEKMSDRMSEDMPDRMPERMSERMSEDMPDRMSEDMPERMSEDMPDRMSEDMPDKMPWDMPDRMPEDMPDRMPEDIPDRMPEDMPDRMPEGMPNRMPDKMSDRMPQNMPDRIPEDMPEDVPDRMPEDMSEYIPEDMPDRMPEDMSDRMPENMPDRMPEDLPDRMPEDMPEDMPDRMPNRMSEDMSDRMPEDLPVRKCIKVMLLFGVLRPGCVFRYFFPELWSM